MQLSSLGRAPFPKSVSSSPPLVGTISRWRHGPASSQPDSHIELPVKRFRIKCYNGTPDRRMYFLFVFKYKYSTVPLFTYIMHFIYIVYISDIDNRWCDWLKYSPLLRQINKYTTFVTIRAKRGSAGLVVLLIVWLIAFLKIRILHHINLYFQCLFVFTCLFTIILMAESFISGINLAHCSQLNEGALRAGDCF